MKLVTFLVAKKKYKKCGTSEAFILCGYRELSVKNIKMTQNYN